MAEKKPAKKTASGPKTKAVLDELRESEKTYRGIFEYGGTPIAVISEDLVIRLANARFLELSGYPRGEVEQNKRWTEFVATRDVERTEQYIAENLRPGGWAPGLFSFGFVEQSGSIRDMGASMTLLSGSRLIVISLVDLGPRKKVERMLRLNEERYQKLVKNLKTGVFRAMYDDPGRLIWANPAFLAIFGYGSLGNLPRVTFAAMFSDSRDHDRAETDLRDKGICRLEKIPMRRMDGSLLWASISLELRENEGGTAWIDGTVENITDSVRADEALKEAKSRLGEVLDAVTTYSLFATDPEGILTMFNTGSERMLGYRAEELIGKETPLCFLAPQTGTGESGPEGFGTFLSRAEAQGCDETECVLRRADGELIPVDLTLSVMRNERGTITGYLGVAQEISDRKRLEEAFRHDKLQMSGVIYHLPDPTFAIDRAGKVIAWNRAVEELSGIKAVDILGKSNFEHALPFSGERNPMLADLIFAPEDEIRLHGYTRIVKKENAVAAEISFPRMPGSIVRATAAPIYDEAGEISGAIETISDITEARRRETELQDSESRFRTILDYIGAAVAILDQDLTITYINPEFERLIGYVHEEVEGKRKLNEFIAPDEGDLFRTLRRSPAGQVLPVKGEVRFIRWDGQIRNGHVSIEPIPDSGNAILSLLDITERIRAEEAVQRANEKLNFFSSITRHDILNQLTALKGNLELTRETAGDDERLVTSVTKELAAADGIQDLILFTRDYQDIGIQPPEWQDVREVILKSCTGIRLGAITVTVPVSGIEIYADMLLERVFYHLLNNALRHGGESLTEIRFSGQESFDEFIIACEDNGTGVPEGAKERIFTRQPFSGSGLGLFVSREILSITGIGVRETGSFGSGARFEIRVPRGAYRFTGGNPGPEAG